MNRNQEGLPALLPCANEGCAGAVPMVVRVNHSVVIQCPVCQRAIPLSSAEEAAKKWNDEYGQRKA